MIDFKMTEEQRMLRDVCRRFVREEVIPICAEFDREPDPTKSFPHALLLKADAVGLRKLGLPEAYGGIDVDTLTSCILDEELATGDLAVAGFLDQTWRLCRLFTQLCSEGQRERFLPIISEDPGAMLSVCMTEDVGGSNNFLLIDREDSRMRTHAEFRDGQWVLNGTKHFIANAGLSKLYLILAVTDPDKSILDAISVFVVPHDAPGLHIGKVEDKMGQRMLRNATVHMEDCTIPAENILGERSEGLAAVVRILSEEGSSIELGALALGAARAAYEAALAHAQQRFIGGKLMIHHQLVHSRLARIKMRLDATRAYVYRAAANVSDPGEETDRSITALAKVYATETAFEIAKESMELFGGYGYMKDLPMEKYLRDIAGTLHEDGVNDVVVLRAARVLYDLPPVLFN